MSTNRRQFIRQSTTAAAGIALGQVHPATAAAATRRTTTATESGAPAAESRVHARRVPLDRVRLTGGPLQRAQVADGVYLLSLEPDRMMALYRTRAGLAPKAQPYPGWDGPGRNLTGHIAGHHLSAVSLMYVATGDARFKQRADYLVSEMKEVQDKNGDGYLSALENGREAFAALSRGEIRSAPFDLNGLWSPWYTLHKTFAGLRDSHRYTGNKTALDVETKFAGWADGILAPLNAEQLARMLNTEHGGMNEVLADLYVDTGDRRWLDLSYKFEHHAFTDALKRHQDNLAGKHGNCQIPKLIGSAARYEYTGDPGDLVAAAFFWDTVAQHHSYATGGNGLDEYFGSADQVSTRVDGRACESCNVYNMLKLTRRLFSFRPDPFYADFHEQALFNHALASFDPDQRRMSYMVPVGRAVQQEYQNMQRSFTCCVGTGMENHALHGDGIYYESADTVWVNIFAPSTAELSNGAHVTMETDFPDGDHATLTLSAPRPTNFTLAIRRPGWAGDGYTVKVNGEPVSVPAEASLRAGAAGGRDLGFDALLPPPSSYVEVHRAWTTGDTVEITLPKTVRVAAAPDNASVAAVMWGPLVLAGNLGARREGASDDGTDGSGGHARIEPIVAPALVAADRPIDRWVVPSNTRLGDFRAVGVARTFAQPTEPLGDVALTPFYRTQERTYSVYFDVVTPAQFDAHVAALAADREHQQRVEAATVAFVRPGDTQAEQTYDYHSDPANRALIRTQRHMARGGTGWFSYDLPVESSGDMALLVTYYNDLGFPVLARFRVLVDGAPIAVYEPNRTATTFWDARYALPASAVAGKSKVTVRFEAETGSRIVPVYGLRMIRANQVSD